MTDKPTARSRTDAAAAPESEATTVAAPVAAPQPPARDAHTGKGGHYEIRNGQRVLVQRTNPKE